MQGAIHLTVSQAQIDRCTSVEIVWNTDDATLTIIVYRIREEKIQRYLITEEIGPFGSVGEMRHELHIRFGSSAAHRLCHPNDPHP